ncbi:hypothetical protein AXF42_Ash018145 [Apostasia shenzhenica]|uniref:Uncharacterized protein n=1 Tax=Apostasia shenzhenica TaxID=1088818 RepID=A0A2I0AF43_9ASPA|nr:hypothetical protein AXF42_Ash018145 [Apostasia shenzhenica]
MASVGNVRLCYQAAAGLLLLLLLLIIISGSVEGIQPITIHHLTAAKEMTRACLAAILEHNIGEMLKVEPSDLLKLKEPLAASYVISPDGTIHYLVKFFAVSYFYPQDGGPPALISMLIQATASYTLREARLDPLGNIDGKTLRVELD